MIRRVQAAGDIGGGSSDITWQALGLVGTKLNDDCALGAGYRAIGTDFSNGGFTDGIVSHGSILGRHACTTKMDGQNFCGM